MTSTSNDHILVPVLELIPFNDFLIIMTIVAINDCELYSIIINYYYYKIRQQAKTVVYIMRGILSN